MTELSGKEWQSQGFGSTGLKGNPGLAKAVPEGPPEPSVVKLGHADFVMDLVDGRTVQVQGAGKAVQIARLVLVI